MKFCPQCGTQNNSSAQFCINCGFHFDISESETPDSATIASTTSFNTSEGHYEPSPTSKIEQEHGQTNVSPQENLKGRNFGVTVAIIIGGFSGAFYASGWRVMATAFNILGGVVITELNGSNLNRRSIFQIFLMGITASVVTFMSIF
ncbi:MULTISPECIES: zinc-ribbon domain-containing protein [Furfurilactobacillus]|uniref:Zinc-ribbon domain-containing protein n=1 Tax=Furfurilactobacillus rossiae TaxID=231049 RepID=A0A7C9NRW6_9LACO|nr:zinc ribbon domain-containing protein [Furfurilactobacillus milii]MYV05411.1 zinc-ribbon domain-containing protein [Furfurilactobacillus milii]